MPWIKLVKEYIIFDPKVQTYCNNSNFKCPNYGHSWACPPEAPYLENQIMQYEHFFLVYIKKVLNQSRSKNFRKYEFMRDSMEMEISKCINKVKNSFEKIQILWDGHCKLCEKEGKKCTIDDNSPCRYPNDIRYSMEAVGINVAETVQNVKLDIEWPPKNHIFRFALICLK